jgi:hypothetical protein
VSESAGPVDGVAVTVTVSDEVAVTVTGLGSSIRLAALKIEQPMFNSARYDSQSEPNWRANSADSCVPSRYCVQKASASAASAKSRV